MPKIFPSRDSDFNIYTQTVVPYIVQHAVRFALSTGNSVKLDQLKVAWDGYFSPSQDKNQRTTTITQYKNETRLAMERTLAAIYRDIPQSVLTNEDRQTLLLHKADRSVKRSGITDMPLVHIAATGGAIIALVCRQNNDSARASMHPGADAIEVAYTIGNASPAWADACNKTVVIQRSRFTIHLAGASIGQTFYCFVRWANLRHPAKSGPWCNMLSTVVV